MLKRTLAYWWQRNQKRTQRRSWSSVTLADVQALEIRCLPSAAIQGRVWHERDGEPSIRDTAVYLNGIEVELWADGQLLSTVQTADYDLDSNGVVDPATETGWYSFEDLQPGTYHVYQVGVGPLGQRFPRPRDGRELISDPRPVAGGHTVTLGPGDLARGDFDFERKNISTTLNRPAPLDAGVSLFSENWSTISADPGSDALVGVIPEGRSGVIAVVLDAMPTADVTVNLATDQLKRISFSVAEVTFTPENWYVPQEVTVEATDDAVDGDNQFVRISASVSQSEDIHFQHIAPAELPLLIGDDDADLSGVVWNDLNEDGRRDLREPALNGRTIELRAEDNTVVASTVTQDIDINGDGLIDPATERGQFRFKNVGSGNYFVAHIGDADHTHPRYDDYAVHLSFESLNLDRLRDVFYVPDLIVGGDDDFVVDVVDNSGSTTNRLFLAPPPNLQFGYVTDNGQELRDLVTATAISSTEIQENGGSVDISVRLNRAPNSNVVVAATASVADAVDITHGELIFTPENWNLPQIVTINAADDSGHFGTSRVKLRFLVDESISDSAFTDTLPAAVDIVVRHNQNIISGKPSTRGEELNGLPIYLLDESGALLHKSETSRFAEPVTRFHQSWFGLQFSQWHPAGEFTFNDIPDGNYTVSTPFGRQDVVAGQTAVYRAHKGHTVAEGAGAVSIPVFAPFKPDQQLVLRLTADSSAGVVVSPSEFVFSVDDWEIPRSIELSVPEDEVARGSGDFAVTISVDRTRSDPAFFDHPDREISVRVDDNDIPEIVVDASETRLWEWGGPRPLMVSLSHQPAAPVEVRVEAAAIENRSADITVLNAPILFTPDNWNEPREVRVQALRDGFADGNTVSQVVVSVTDLNSAEAFRDIEAQSVEFTTIDTDTVRITPVVDKTNQSPLITWSPHVHAESYDIQFEQIGSSTVHFRDRSFEQTSFRHQQVLGIGRYRIWIAANLSDGTRTGWNSMSFKIVPELSIPDLRIDDAGHVAASWNAMDGATDYRVYVRYPNGSNHDPLDTRISDTAIDLGELPYGRTTVWVQAIGPAGVASRWSRPLHHVRSLGETTLHPLEVNDDGTGRINWGAAAGATHYRIYALNARDTPFVDEIVEATFLEFEQLAFGTTKFWVQPLIPGQVQGDWSSPQETAITLTLLSPHGTEHSGGQRTFRWNAVPGATHYELSIRRPGRGTALEYTFSDIAEIEYTPDIDFGLGEFFWSVSTYRAGERTLRAASTFQVGPNPVILTPQSIDGVVNLRWEPIPNAVRYSYEVRGKDNFIAKGSTTDLESNPIGPLDPGTYYVWLIVTNNGWGSGLWNEVSELTVAPGITTSDLRATSGYTGFPNLQWAPVPDAVSYDVFIRMKQNKSRTRLIRAVQETEYKVTDSLDYGTYDWWVAPRFDDSTISMWSQPGRIAAWGATRFVGDYSTVSATPTFQWEAVGWASEYQLVLAGLPSGAAYFSADTNEFQFESPLPAGDYRLWVRALGNNPTWSRALSFSVVVMDSHEN